MAWPCISRVCCLARFWSQLDKSDLSVPLTIHNYSDIEEQEGGGGPPRGAAAGSPPRAGGRLPAAPRAPAARRGSGDGGARRKGPAGAAGAAAAEPFAAETQYRQDFRAWPVQRRDAFPWIGSGGDCRRNGAAAPGSSVYVLPAGDAEGRPGGSRHSGFPQLWPRSRADGAHTTSYRQEYRPWTGAKPSKPIKTKQGFIIPEEHFVQETSYKADFKEAGKLNISKIGELTENQEGTELLETALTTMHQLCSEMIARMESARHLPGSSGADLKYLCNLDSCA